MLSELSCHMGSNTKITTWSDNLPIKRNNEDEDRKEGSDAAPHFYVIDITQQRLSRMCNNTLLFIINIYSLSMFAHVDK